MSGVAVERPGQSLVSIGRGFEAYIPASGLIDVNSEVKRLTGEKERVKKVLAGIKAKLDNKNFVDKAPEDVLEQTNAQFNNMSSQLQSIEENLKALS